MDFELVKDTCRKLTMLLWEATVLKQKIIAD